ncbi:DUF3152 domain-containing protein [Streptomyces sp. NPDC059002]|uniref:DUF3152 domain-containing protein n=1 Tax=Streptomyces sp. NPDC059002 TaxID=3346690 RepID=UPI0036BFF1FC
MGRHSRRGPAGTENTTGTSGIPLAQGASAGAARPPGPGTGRRRRVPTEDGTPAQGAPAHGTPAQGTPAQGTPAHGTPAHGTPAQGTPAHGTPAHGTPQAHVRGGHPEQREPGGGWGDGTGTGTGSGPRVGAGYGVPPRVPGPRQEYVEAFPGKGRGDDPAPSAPPPPRDPYASVTDWGDAPELPLAADGAEGDGDDGDGEKSGKGRTFTGIAAAAVTTVLAVVVAGQVADGPEESGPRTQAAPGGGARDTDDPASRSDARPTPSAAPLTYDQKMGKKYPLDAKLKASGDFEAISGFDKAPGKGRLWKYRVDVEKGLGLDGELFAQAVQKTLNDDRSWAHAGARTFERISSGKPDFVITLASPGTTAAWCAKSGLDTTQDNVSCDSAATERVMINAYRWAQGAKTYGDAVKKEFGNVIFPYRQMLINHEVGHRLGFNHTDCTKDGDLAPVMQQQTKFLDHDGIKCRANPWAFPKS